MGHLPNKHRAFSAVKQLERTKGKGILKSTYQPVRFLNTNIQTTNLTQKNAKYSLKINQRLKISQKKKKIIKTRKSIKESTNLNIPQFEVIPTKLSKKENYLKKEAKYIKFLR